MRHREQTDESNETGTGAGATGSLTELMAFERPLPGKHRAQVAVPLIPAQTHPTHDTDVQARVAAVTDATLLPAPPPAMAACPGPVAQPPVTIPTSARWRASHLPRVLVGALLGMSSLGAAALGLRYFQSRSSDDFTSLVIGLGVVVALWALLIASTPQVVSLEGPVLTVRNARGSEKFDLSDGLQPVDVVGSPQTSHWAVLLHRPDTTTVVLRHHDVVAKELDPIVRHYRMVAERRFAERDSRFNR